MCERKQQHCVLNTLVGKNNNNNNNIITITIYSCIRNAWKTPTT